MVEGKCLNCGKVLQLKDKFAGKRVRCPDCQTPVLLGGQGDMRLDKSALRQELARLAASKTSEGGQADRGVEAEEPAGEGPAPAEESAAEAPARQTPPPRPAPKPAEPKRAAPAKATPRGPEIREARRSYRGLIIALAIVLAVCAVGLGAFMTTVHLRKRFERQRKSQRDQVTEAIQAARRATAPCREAEALKLHEQALDEARNYEKIYSDRSFVEAITEMQQQVARLSQYLDSRRKLLEQLDQGLAEARKLLEEKKYAEAKQSLEKTREKGAALQSSCKTERVESVVKEVDRLLASDEVKFGSRGWVFFNNTWMSPADKKRLEEQMEEEKYAKMGLVKFRGKWVKAEERDKILKEELAVAEQKKKEEEERAKAMAAARDARASLGQALKSDEKVVVIDDAARILWASEGWANPAKFELVSADQYGKKGEKWLKITLEGGEKDKWAITYALNADISARDFLTADFVVTKGKPEIALALKTNPGWKWFESPVRRLRPGISRDVSYNLKAKNFKCLESNWTYTEAVKNPEAVAQVLMVIYGGAGTEILMTDVRLIKGAAPPEKTTPLPP